MSNEQGREDSKFRHCRKRQLCKRRLKVLVLQPIFVHVKKDYRERCCNNFWKVIFNLLVPINCLSNLQVMHVMLFLKCSSICSLFEDISSFDWNHCSVKKVRFLRYLRWISLNSSNSKRVKQMIVQGGVAVMKFLSVFFFFFCLKLDIYSVSSFINSDGEINTRRKMTNVSWQVIRH